jgi:hypothetical protein
MNFITPNTEIAEIRLSIPRNAGHAPATFLEIGQLQRRHQQCYSQAFMLMIHRCYNEIKILKSTRRYQNRLFS